MNHKLIGILLTVVLITGITSLVQAGQPAAARVSNRGIPPSQWRYSSFVSGFFSVPAAFTTVKTPDGVRR